MKLDFEAEQFLAGAFLQPRRVQFGLCENGKATERFKTLKPRGAKRSYDDYVDVSVADLVVKRQREA